MHIVTNRFAFKGEKNAFLQASIICCIGEKNRIDSDLQLGKLAYVSSEYTEKDRTKFQSRKNERIEFAAR